MNKEMDVTVLILCYNSSKTLVETLDSVQRQTYKRIHLIISDDCSTDNTYELAESWTKENQTGFLSCVLNKTDSNLGISQHINSCLRLIQTSWFKPFAADDILLPDCIEKYVAYVRHYNYQGIIYSKHLSFIEDEEGKHFNIDYEEQLYQNKFGKMSAKNQRVAIAKRDILCSPSCFMNREAILAAGGYDLRIRNIDDWPIKMRLLDKGYKMHQMKDYTVLYRMGDSISRSNKSYFKCEHVEMEKKVKRLYCYPIAKKSALYRWNNMINNFRYYIIINILKNKKNTFNRVVNYFIGCLNTEKLRKAIVNCLHNRETKIEVKRVMHLYNID